MKHFLDCVRGVVIRRRFRVLPVLQPLVCHVLCAFLVIVAGHEKVLQTLPMLIQVHTGRPGDGPQTVGVVVPVRFQHLNNGNNNNYITALTGIQRISIGWSDMQRKSHARTERIRYSAIAINDFETNRPCTAQERQVCETRARSGSATRDSRLNASRVIRNEA